MVVSGTVEHVLKHSFLYSYILSQPFAVYVDAYPVLQNKVLLEAETLEYGQHGESVRVLQTKLNTLNYYDDEIDGKYGVFTEHALMQFQTEHHIAVTGQADQETILAVIKVEAEKELEKLEKLSGSIYPGLYSEDVKIVQEALFYFGYYTGEIDGIYGPLTKQALETAENNHELDLSTKITSEEIAQLQEDVEEITEYQEQQVTVKKEAKKEVKQPEVKKVPTQATSHGNIIQTAQAYLGTPYVWGGTSPGGFDCSGFIQFVYQSENKVIPRTVSDIWNFSKPVDGSPSIGDLVFFQTYKAGPSHMGIYLGNNQFIHASQSNGVEIGNLDQAYWQSRYIGAKRVQ